MLWLLVLAADRAVQAFGSDHVEWDGRAGKQNSLMAEYSSLLAESVLRHKAWFAEHTARVETAAGEQGQVRIHRQHEP